MNESILENERERRDTWRTSVRPSEAGDDEEGLSPGRYHSQYHKVLEKQVEIQDSVTFNTVRVIFVFQFIPLFAIVASLVLYPWYVMANETGFSYTYWVNLLMIVKYDTIGQKIVYQFLMFDFYNADCVDGNLTNDDPVGLCNLMTSYFYAGLVAAAVVVAGIVAHSYHIYKLASFGCRSKNRLEKGIGILFLPYFILFCYTSSLVYWFFGSATLLNGNADLNVLQRFGYSMMIYAGAVFFFFLLSSWLNHIMKGAFNRNDVTKILKAEKKLLEAIESKVDV
jgi:hypothetical protein